MIFLPQLNPAEAQSRFWIRCACFRSLMLLLLFGLVVSALPVTLRAEDAARTNALKAVLAALAAPTNPPVTLSTNQATAAPGTGDFNILDDKYRLAIGDQISFRIIEDEDDPKTLVVTDSGEIQVPYIGRYPAVGKTCKELAQALKAELEKDYYYQATVVIGVDSKPRSRGKIYLVGAIRAAGPQDISGDEQLTVSKAILRAGGFADFADEKNVRITRGSGNGPGGKQSITVNVAAIFEKGKTENDLLLQPGDLIFVPERMIRF